MARLRTDYGANKYAALHLIWCKWLRKHSRNVDYRYVTLGGTELQDIINFQFIDESLLRHPITYEADPGRYAIAQATAQSINLTQPITALRGDIFSFQREHQLPHLFFFDFEGVCAAADYHIRFGNLLMDEHLIEGDTLFITSYLGRNPGWNRVFASYEAEFLVLGVHDDASRKAWYRRAHPSFTLYKALHHMDLNDEIAIECFGCVEYRDTSPMAVYGYNILPGRTSFRKLVTETPHFAIGRAGLTTGQ